MKKLTLVAALCASLTSLQASAAVITDITLTDTDYSANIFSGSWDLATQGTLTLDAVNDHSINGYPHELDDRWHMNITVSSVGANETVNAVMNLGFTTLDINNNISFPTHNGLTASTSSNGVFGPSTLSPEANRIFTFSYTLDISQVTASPVPVPAAAWLFLGGIGALGFMKRRKENS